MSLSSAKFYGATPPSALLRSALANEKPSLKQAFEQQSSAPKGQASSNLNQTSKQQGKKCTAHFGCANVAVFTEDSGTLYCRDHKPKQIPVTNIKTADSKLTGKKRMVDLLLQSARHDLLKLFLLRSNHSFIIIFSFCTH